MQIKQISVKKLFDIFDHIISLNTKERVTIIHSPNGYGKTVMLQMIDGLLNGRYGIFTQIPFRSFSIEFDDGVKLRVEQRKSKSGTPKSVVIHGPGDKPFDLSREGAELESRGFPLGIIEELVPDLVRLGPSSLSERRLPKHETNAYRV